MMDQIFWLYSVYLWEAAWGDFRQLFFLCCQVLSAAVEAFMEDGCMRLTCGKPPLKGSNYKKREKTIYTWMHIHLSTCFNTLYPQGKNNTKSHEAQPDFHSVIKRDISSRFLFLFYLCVLHVFELAGSLQQDKITLLVVLCYNIFLSGVFLHQNSETPLQKKKIIKICNWKCVTSSETWRMRHLSDFIRKHFWLSHDCESSKKLKRRLPLALPNWLIYNKHVKLIKLERK